MPRGGARPGAGRKPKNIDAAPARQAPKVTKKRTRRDNVEIPAPSLIGPTTSIAELAKSYTLPALATLYAVMIKHGASDSARVQAATALLNRAYGAPTQPVQPVFDPSTLTNEQLEAISRAYVAAGLITDPTGGPVGGDPATPRTH